MITAFFAFVTVSFFVAVVADLAASVTDAGSFAWTGCVEIGGRRTTNPVSYSTESAMDKERDPGPVGALICLGLALALLLII